jgi:hypothetical protein
MPAVCLPVACLPVACRPVACRPVACHPLACCCPVACLPVASLPVACLPSLFYFKILSIIRNVKEIISSLFDFFNEYFFDNFIDFDVFNDNFLIILRLHYLTIC